MFRALVVGASLATSTWTSARAQDIAVPIATIYPGDLIAPGMLTDTDTDAQDGTFLPRDALVGRTARRTLLPGKPVPAGAVGDTRLVKTGANVEISYVAGGLSIRTRGVAMQNGSVGETVSVRNAQTGHLLSGTIASDGSVRIEAP